MNIGKKTCTKFRNAIKDGICPDADKKIKCKEYEKIETVNCWGQAPMWSK